jgi:alpha-D-ribose 1-methylphosphonate 5-triphosphate diphosphatase PhnM
LMTSAPGRVIGGRGVLAVGQPADMVALEWHGGSDAPQVVGVWSRGVRSE